MTDKRTKEVETLLRKYNVTKVYIENLHAELEEYQTQLNLTAAPKVPSLSFAPGSNGEMLSQEEKSMCEKEKIEEQQKNIQEELNKIEPVIKRLDRSIEALSYTDRTIVVERFINGASWMRIADMLHLSEPAVRKRSVRVLEKVSMMMFGPLSIPLQMHFVFTDRN